MSKEYTVKFGKWVSQGGRRYWTGTKEDLILAKKANLLSPGDEVVIHERPIDVGTVIMSVKDSVAGYIKCDGRAFDPALTELLALYPSGYVPDWRECAPTMAGQSAVQNIGAHDVFTVNEIKADMLGSHVHAATVTDNGHTHQLLMNKHQHSVSFTIDGHTHTYSIPSMSHSVTVYNERCVFDPSTNATSLWIGGTGGVNGDYKQVESFTNAVFTAKNEAIDQKKALVSDTYDEKERQYLLKIAFLWLKGSLGKTPNHTDNPSIVDESGNIISDASLTDLKSWLNSAADGDYDDETKQYIETLESQKQADLDALDAAKINLSSGSSSLSILGSLSSTMYTTSNGGAADPATWAEITAPFSNVSVTIADHPAQNNLTTGTAGGQTVSANTSSAGPTNETTEQATTGIAVEVQSAGGSVTRGKRFGINFFIKY